MRLNKLMTKKLSNLMITLSLIFFIGCNTASRETFLNSYEVKSSEFIGDSISIQINPGIDNKRAGQTSMMAVGGSYINVSNGRRFSGYDDVRFNKYGLQLAKVLKDQGLFKNSTYTQIGNPIKKSTYHLDINFTKTWMGKDGWPLELHVNFELSKENKTILNKQYKSVARSFSINNPMNALPTDIAEKKLNLQFLDDLIK